MTRTPALACACLALVLSISLAAAVSVAAPADLPGSVTGVQVLKRGSTAIGMTLSIRAHAVTGLPAAPSPIAVDVLTYESAREQGEAPRLTGAQAMRTRIDGTLELPAALPRTLRAVRFQEAGATTEVRIPGSGRHSVSIYHAPLANDDVTMDVRTNMSVRDGGASTWLEITITTDKPGVRRWTKADPLVLPLVAPAVRDTVMDRGAINKATKNIEVQTRDAVKVERAGGGLALEGAVAPGRTITLRVHYGLAIEQPTVDLGLRGVVGSTSFSLATIATPPVLIEMSADRPARVAEHREGRERYAGASLIHPLKRGEVARIRLVGFPAPSPWPGRMLGGAAAAMFLAFSAFIARRRGSG